MYRHSLKRIIVSKAKKSLKPNSSNRNILLLCSLSTPFLEVKAFVSDGVNICICEIVANIEGSNKPFGPFGPFGKLTTHSRNGLQK